MGNITYIRAIYNTSGQDTVRFSNSEASRDNRVIQPQKVERFNDPTPRIPWGYESFIGYKTPKDHHMTIELGNQIWYIWQHANNIRVGSSLDNPDRPHIEGASQKGGEKALIISKFGLLLENWHSSWTPYKEPTVTPGNTFLTDKDNRQLILKGVSSSNYSKNEGGANPEHNPWETEEAINIQVKEFGFSIFRYLIFWDGLMPERDGNINQDYLARIRKRLDIYEKLGAKVILDMHQDIWGSQCGYNGAPDWATIGEYTPPKGQPFALSGMTSCYRDSFDAFWENQDGVQDQFIATWQAVAKAFKDHPAVIGYDLFNEPGKTDANIDVVLSFAYYQYGYLGISFDSLPIDLGPFDPAGALVRIVEAINTTHQRYKNHPSHELRNDIIRLLSNLKDAANQLLGAQTSAFDVENLVDVVLDGEYKWGLKEPAYFKRFEQDYLTPFYQKIIDAIREYDTDSVIFVEPTSVAINNGFRTFLGNLSDPKGKPHKLGYMPHAYPIPLDVRSLPYLRENIEIYLDHWFEVNQTYANQQGMVLLVGEFGVGSAYEEGKQQKYLNLFNRWAEAYKVGSVFYASDDFQLKEPNGNRVPIHTNRTEETTLLTVYPRATAGRIESYSFEQETKKFSMKYTTSEDIKGQTEIVVPKHLWSDNIAITADYKEGFSYELKPDWGLIYLTDVVRDEPQSVHIKF